MYYYTFPRTKKYKFYTHTPKQVKLLAQKDHFIRVTKLEKMYFTKHSNKQEASLT